MAGINKKNKIPLEKHKLLFQTISENIRNGMSMEEAMLANGYSPSYAKSSTHLKETNSWQTILKTVISDDKLSQVHDGLLKATRLDHMTFPPYNEGDNKKKKRKRGDELTDEMIIELLAGVNCQVKKIVHGEMARHIYFWSADNRARKDGLDMGYKLKGKYEPEQHNIKFNSFSKEQLVDLILGKMK